jgi:hypothetical protein
VWPPSSSKTGGNRDSAPRDGDGATEQWRTRGVPILVDLRGAAAAFAISKRAFQVLRKRSDFPENATVVLGPRCVRFRVEALQKFALSMASCPQISPRSADRGPQSTVPGAGR